MLPRSREALSRLEEGLERLSAAQSEPNDFRFILPLVLDHAVAVTRTIDKESKGRRTHGFGAWWKEVDQEERLAIQELRNAELKEQERRSGRHIGISLTDTVIFDDSVSGVVLGPDGELHAVTGTPQQHTYVPPRTEGVETTTEWVFRGGAFDGQAVIPTLQRRLGRLRDEILPKAEELLDAP